MTQQINLSQNKIAVVNDEDFARVSQFHWCYRAERNNKPGYAIRHEKVDGSYKTRYLHREIITPPPGKEVIFLNHDRLDCRRENLKDVTKEEARQHHRARCDNLAGLKGISYNRHPQTWSVDIWRKGKVKRVGTFLTRG